ncbi:MULTISPECIES: rubredoxin [Nitrospirillum]|uniref:Rubredoxin n=2 Tax=Nitrospirillum TaxID=1543705 RepID=A0A248JUJ2_9PROT|nr:rubredoxin [Nitrospirillum amazonense]ASG22365.1 rubredoxin [Nitrospirillum amazonense CBAmc]MDG3444274.1 rubredoxin [Nitrospirillum amazonense]TWB43104.1 rubredoxin [Nitrospirillum amazonense]TWB77829.1 rubredoxin [Nitrospirillum amazonense]
MTDHFFAGSFGGDVSKISPGTKLECKICWHVYDPAVGDTYWQVPPGTAFADLPEHWTCPECDSAKAGFMVIADE